MDMAGNYYLRASLGQLGKGQISANRRVLLTIAWRQQGMMTEYEPVPSIPLNLTQARQCVI
jgi:hypothetical protein